MSDTTEALLRRLVQINEEILERSDEGFSQLRSEIGGLRAEVGGVRGEVGGLRGDVQTLTGRFDGFVRTNYGKYDDLESRVEQVERRLDAIEPKPRS